MKVVDNTTGLIDANRLKLAEYLAIPKSLRPMTLKAFAKEVLRVSEPTIHAWKKMPEVMSLVRKTIENSFADDIPDVLLALRDGAIAGNPRAAKLFLEYIDAGSDSYEEPANNSLKKEMTVEEAKKEIAILVKKFYPEAAQ